MTQSRTSRDNKHPLNGDYGDGSGEGPLDGDFGSAESADENRRDVASGCKA